MRYQTKLIKNILIRSFPHAMFNVLFMPAKQYCDTSDKILVKIQGEEYTRVVNILLKNTKDIKITSKGVCTSVSGVTHPQIYDVDKERFVDADLLEFIEIETKNTPSG